MGGARGRPPARRPPPAAPARPRMVAGSPRMEVEVIGDTSSLEIFINGGRVVHSLNVFAPATCNEIAVEPHGGDAALADIRGYALRP